MDLLLLVTRVERSPSISTVTVVGVWLDHQTICISGLSECWVSRQVPRGSGVYDVSSTVPFHIRVTVTPTLTKGPECLRPTSRMLSTELDPDPKRELRRYFFHHFFLLRTFFLRGHTWYVNPDYTFVQGSPLSTQGLGEVRTYL